MSNTSKAYWSGHILQFDSKPPLQLDAATGAKLLLVFAVMEYVLGPRLALAGWLGLPVPPATVLVPVLLVLAMVLIRVYAGVEFSRIGLYAWKHWSRSERWYFFQTIILANGIFATIFLPRIKTILSDPAMWGAAAGALLLQLLWGFHQELIYRGVLQTELVRRWGTWSGILASNLLFTFGPLHFYHFRAVTENPSHAWMFAAIFAIGLFFGVLFQRSGNLWIVGIFHGIGDWYITGLPQLVTTS